jgi:hypothetical protein
MGELFEEKESAALVESGTREAGDSSSLIRLAIERNIDMDKLQKLIDMKNAEEERQAKLAFNFHFAEMQKDFVPVSREKQGYDYKYAPIELLQKTYGPIIARHGFSYVWREESIPEGKRCYLTITGFGHSQENYFDIPPLEKTKQMNSVQVMGAMSTYGRRYTFIAGFGVIIEDEDPDAYIPIDADVLEMDLRAFIDSGKLFPEAAGIIVKELAKESPSPEKLKAYWKRARAKVEGTR